MIKTLVIRNFKSHIRSVFNFVPGTNVIVGLSDHGKSVIISALRWIKDNKPLGNSYKSWKGGDPYVKVVTTEGQKVVRTEDSEKAYIINDTLRLTAFGTDTPKEVDDVLNMSNINLQRQFEPHFLLSKSPGEVARFFNQIAHLDKIDIGLQNVEKWIREIRSILKHKQKDIEQKQKELKQYDYLEKIEIEVEVLEDLVTKRDSKQRKANELSKLKESLLELNENIRRKQSILLLEKPINTVFIQIEKKKKLEIDKTRLTKICNQINELNDYIKKQQPLIDSEQLINKLIQIINKRNEFKQTIEKMNSFVNQIKQKNIDLKQAEINYKTWHKQFKDNFPDICPLCNKPK
jgi:exonuclease SbcC